MVSVALSVLLSVVVNLALRLFPGAGDRVARRLSRLTWPHLEEGLDDGHDVERGVRVFVPWKAMIFGSVILTVVLNLLLWAT